ncbi:hypothetical protein DFH28DRAFT_1087716 [Melampsora americana]|nr:hypothetical protein DFH28DRAFT_1087716 [Melampsora americana]
MERIWADFEPLVRALRYLTKQHRITALNFCGKQKNAQGRDKSVVNSLTHLHKTKKKLADSRAILTKLHIYHGHTKQYFWDQWEQKKTIQRQIISETSKEYLEHVGELIDLEEKLVAAQRCQWQRQGQRNQGHLPNTLVLLEQAIDNLNGRSAQPLIKIQVAKGKLLGAKAGVIEHQQRASHAQGTNVQKKMNTLRNMKNAQLHCKHATYGLLAKDYNEQFNPETPLPTPSLQEVEAMPLKAWAVDEATQDAIESYITMCHCQEELQRIAKEVKQMVCWAVDYQDKINTLRQDTLRDVLPIWAASKDWNSKILVLLDETAADHVCETCSDEKLKAKWSSMFEFALQEWEKMI